MAFPDLARPVGDHNVPPVQDGDWDVVPVLSRQRTVPSTGVFETTTLVQRTHRETGDVVLGVETVVFLKGGTHQTSTQITPEEFFSRLR